ncbi:hypothetical protein [Gordonia hydrophobica]|uniref:Uncharacterized protein n=1 Tax=Gordonia hydrophobica TaxID=40516 RepID=A0ABZ2U751_9ACTN|nr:hypothetical protein [Gordonia hydrophobica]MBM7368192.1 hypothetical protein [Gordonia hydrophobica]
MSSHSADRPIPYLPIGYLLLLVQFVLLGLSVSTLAADARGTVVTTLFLAWAVTLVASIVAFVLQAKTNRADDGQATPSPHLIVPAESTDRVAAYHAIYRSPDASAPADDRTERAAA